MVKVVRLIRNSKKHLAGMVLPWWLLLIADWLTLGRDERGGSLRVEVGGRLLDRSSLGWKFPTAYTPCIQTHPHKVKHGGACSKNISIKSSNFMWQQCQFLSPIKAFTKAFFKVTVKWKLEYLYLQ